VFLQISINDGIEIFCYNPSKKLNHKNHQSDTRLMNINLWCTLIYGHVWLPALAGVANPINFSGQFFSKRN
jgi:hypothetical protein